jgi:hypothetical protein
MLDHLTRLRVKVSPKDGAQALVNQVIFNHPAMMALLIPWVSPDEMSRRKMTAEQMGRLDQAISQQPRSERDRWLEESLYQHTLATTLARNQHEDEAQTRQDEGLEASPVRPRPRRRT